MPSSLTMLYWSLVWRNASAIRAYPASDVYALI